MLHGQVQEVEINPKGQSKVFLPKWEKFCLLLLKTISQRTPLKIYNMAQEINVHCRKFKKYRQSKIRKDVKKITCHIATKTCISFKCILYIYVCIYLYIYKYIIYICMCICICVNVCIFIYVCYIHTDNTNLIEDITDSYLHAPVLPLYL